MLTTTPTIRCTVVAVLALTKTASALIALKDSFSSTVNAFPAVTASQLARLLTLISVKMPSLKKFWVIFLNPPSRPPRKRTSLLWTSIRSTWLLELINALLPPVMASSSNWVTCARNSNIVKRSKRPLIQCLAPSVSLDTSSIPNSVATNNAMPASFPSLLPTNSPLKRPVTTVPTTVNARSVLLVLLKSVLPIPMLWTLFLPKRIARFANNAWTTVHLVLFLIPLPARSFATLARPVSSTIPPLTLVINAASTLIYWPLSLKLNWTKSRLSVVVLNSVKSTGLLPKLSKPMLSIRLSLTPSRPLLTTRLLSVVPVLSIVLSKTVSSSTRTVCTDMPWRITSVLAVVIWLPTLSSVNSTPTSMPTSPHYALLEINTKSPTLTATISKSPLVTLILLSRITLPLTLMFLILTLGARRIPTNAKRWFLSFKNCNWLWKIQFTKVLAVNVSSTVMFPYNIKNLAKISIQSKELFLLVLVAPIFPTLLLVKSLKTFSFLLLVLHHSSWMLLITLARNVMLLVVNVTLMPPLVLSVPPESHWIKSTLVSSWNLQIYSPTVSANRMLMKSNHVKVVLKTTNSLLNLKTSSFVKLSWFKTVKKWTTLLALDVFRRISNTTWRTTNVSPFLKVVPVSQTVPALPANTVTNPSLSMKSRFVFLVTNNTKISNLTFNTTARERWNPPP